MARCAVFVMITLLAAACAPQIEPIAPSAVPTSAAAVLVASAIPSPTATQTAVPTIAPSATPAIPTATPTPPFAICSPLEGIALAELDDPELLKYPFEQPRPGIDDGHHGVDFAYWSRGERTTMQGLPVYSVLAGRVAGVLENRQPYGNAIIIETALDVLPEEWLAALELPERQPTVEPAPNLSCPPDPLTYGQPDRRSLYLLYAHFDQPVTLAVGQPVTCGEQIGIVGTTGRSVNHHLHLETRIGPAGSVIPELAHYETSASITEMSAYCTWRVSGLFSLFDPMRVLRETPPSNPALQP